MAKHANTLKADNAPNLGTLIDELLQEKPDLTRPQLLKALAAKLRDPKLAIYLEAVIVDDVNAGFFAWHKRQPSPAFTSKSGLLPLGKHLGPLVSPPGASVMTFKQKQSTAGFKAHIDRLQAKLVSNIMLSLYDVMPDARLRARWTTNEQLELGDRQKNVLLLVPEASRDVPLGEVWSEETFIKRQKAKS